MVRTFIKTGNPQFFNLSVRSDRDFYTSDVYLTDAPQRLSELGSSLSVKLEPGELFLSIAATVGKPCITGIKACIHDGFVYFPQLKIPNKFLFYIFAASQAYKGLGKMGTQLNLNTETVGRIKVGIGSEEELARIVDFLDYETARIDALIEKQQQLIALVKEKRQAVISHAVTKGLNPDAPMRDSGIEWLGEIPVHWDVARLKHKCQIQSGIPKGKPASATTVELPMLRVANVQDGWLDLNDVHRIPIERSQIGRYLLRRGDVLMNEGGDRDKLGRGTIWREEVSDCVHQNHVFAIRPLAIESEWLDGVTRADYAKFHFYRVAKQSTNLASISSTNIKETPLVIPPSDEREAILKYIDMATEEMNSLISLAQQQSELLQERRTAIISAAVTGKIDVRDWKPPQEALEATTEKEVA